MNAEVISSVLTCLFLIFLILGFLFGLWRGFSKSLTRLLIVIVIAVASFFAVPALSKTILSANISSWNIQVGDVVVQSIDQLISDSLANFEQVKDLMNASPTFTAFIQAVPQILVNLVLFILFFFIAKLISMIIYWILCAILFPKKKTAGKNKHRFVGAVIGAVQGLLVAVIVLMPVFGLMNLSNSAQSALSQSQAEIQTLKTEDSADPQTFYVTVSESNDESTEDEEGSIDKTLAVVNEYTEALESNFIYKTLNTVGLVKLSNSIFDELTTVKANGKDYKLTTEAVEISKMYPYLDLILQSNFDIQSNEFIDNIILLVEKSYDSPLVGDIVTEVIKEAATIWSDSSIDRDQRIFMGMATPDLGSDELNSILDEQLNSIKNATKEDLQTKLVDVLNIAKVANETIKLADDIKESLSEISVENLENIFNTISENETIKDVIKDVVTIDTLDELGINDVGTQTLIVDVVNKIIDAEDADIKKEVAATIEIFALTEKINDAQDLNTTVKLEQTEVESLVDGLANSTIITDLIKTKQNETTVEGVANPIKDLDISNSLHPDTISDLETEINEKITDEELKDTLKQILLGQTQEQED